MGDIASPDLVRLRRSISEHRNDIHTRSLKGSLMDLPSFLPALARVPCDEDGVRAQSASPHLDVILRRAGPGAGLIDVAVGVISRRQHFVPHQQVIHALERALSAVRVNPSQVRAAVELADFGARMALAIDLPSDLDLDAGHGERLGLRLQCTNALNRGGLRFLMSWHRLVSDTSIAVGTTRLEYRLAHRMPVRITDVVPSVRNALERAQSERAGLAAWRQVLITRDQLVSWADGAVRRMWGPRAAARVFHIAMTGFDGEPAYGFERASPSRRTMRATGPVTSVPSFAETAYDALLALAWLAREGREASERFDRQIEMAMLMRALLWRGRRS
jgi:hypothetical protein